MLLPALLGWPYRQLDGDHRKAFEVVLHAATAAGLGLALRREVARAARALGSRDVLAVALATAPATLAGFAFHEPIVARLSTPRRVAMAQVVAGAALGLADRRRTDRSAGEEPLRDAATIGLAQAAALAPGVSRGGAALTALRLRRLDRRSASVASRHAAAPVVLGAGALEAVRLARRPPPRSVRLPFAAGAAAAFCSTIAAAGLAARMDAARSYAPLACYRVALGAGALARLRASSA